MNERIKPGELIITNKELAFQNEEKEKRAAELNTANTELKKAEEYQREYIQGLEEMIFMTSHKVRQPIANILSLTSLFDEPINSPADQKQLVDYIKQSALSLDTFTKELTIFLDDLEEKGKK